MHRFPCKQRHRSGTVLVAAGLYIIASQSVGGQTPGQDTTRGRQSDTVPNSLNSVVVTATRAQTPLEQMPLHTSVISRAEIQKSPARTLDQLLRNVSGVNMPGAPFYTTDPTGQQTRMRGVTNSTVLVLLDGIPIHDPFYSTTQWFKVPLSSIERIEVVRGGASSLWGNLAVAGVVNIITKKPTDNGGLLDVNYQSMNTSNVALSKNWVMNNGLAIRLSGDLFNTDGYQTTPAAFLSTLPGKGASGAKMGNAQLAMYYTPTATVDAFLRAGYHQTNEDIGGYQYGTNLQKSPDAAAGVTKFFSDKSRADVKLWSQSVTFHKENGAGCYLVSSTSCNATSTTAPLVQYANSRDDNPYHEFGGSATLATGGFGRLIPNIQTGIDYRRIGGQDDATTYNKPTTADVSSATINRTNFAKGTQQFLGGFVQASVVPFSGLEAILSARYDYWMNQDGVAEMTPYASGVAGSSTGGAIENSHKGEFDPSLSLRYEMGEHLSLRGAAYQSFRSPGLNNLYRSFSSTTSITIANPELSPQTMTGGELGTDIRGGPFTAGITWFQYNTKGLIASYKVTSASSAPPQVLAICGTTLANCPATVNFNTNGQNALSQGLEFTGSWQAAASLAISGDYTYTDSHYTSTTTGDPTGVQLGAIPKHLATLGVTEQFTGRWNVHAGLRYTSKMYLDVNQTIPQSAFASVDLSTSYRVMRQLELYGSVVNLTDVHYSDNATTNAASETLGIGRAVTGGLRRWF